MTLTGSWDDSSGVHVFRVRSTYNHGYTQTASLFFFFLMIRHPRRSPLFPYTPLFRSDRGGGAPALFWESEALVDEASREIRPAAQLLHPPQLEESGLAAAVRGYSTSFAERSGVE